jgi:NADH:ubiquinone oxidoreductase subunit F (NADH-binding)
LTCIACRKGQIDESTLQKLKEGMASTESNPSARALLRMIKLQGFEAPGKEYAAELKKISEAYPSDHQVDLTKLK